MWPQLIRLPAGGTTCTRKDSDPGRVQPGVIPSVLKGKSPIMRFLFTLLVFCTGFSVQAQTDYNGWGNSKKVKGNGEVTTQARSVRNFDGVEVCCGLTVEARQGSTISVEVEAESNLQEYILTEVRGGRLTVRFADKVNIKSNKNIVVYVTVPSLNYVSVSSGSDFRSVTGFSGEEIELDASSGADLVMDFSGQRVKASASSGANIKLRGKGDRIRAEASSAGNVRAGDFEASRARAGASSGGDVTVHANEELVANASSGGGVRYHGTPSTIDTDKSSGGSVRKAL